MIQTDRQTDRQMSMVCMGSCGATRGASTPQRSVLSLLLSLGCLGMLAACFPHRLALAPPCAHDRPMARQAHGCLCLLAYACLLMLAPACGQCGLAGALSWALCAHCPLESAIAPYGAGNGLCGHPGNAVRTHAYGTMAHNGSTSHFWALLDDLARRSTECSTRVLRTAPRG